MTHVCIRGVANITLNYMIVHKHWRDQCARHAMRTACIWCVCALTFMHVYKRAVPMERWPMHDRARRRLILTQSMEPWPMHGQAHGAPEAAHGAAFFAK